MSPGICQINKVYSQYFVGLQVISYVQIQWHCFDSFYILGYSFWLFKLYIVISLGLQLQFRPELLLTPELYALAFFFTNLCYLSVCSYIIIFLLVRNCSCIRCAHNILYFSVWVCVYLYNSKLDAWLLFCLNNWLVIL